MKPAWDALMEEFAGSPGVVVADVNCVSKEGRGVCDRQGIQGYPTVKYWTIDGDKDGTEYAGGPGFDEACVREVLLFLRDTARSIEVDDGGVKLALYPDAFDVAIAQMRLQFHCFP